MTYLYQSLFRQNPMALRILPFEARYAAKFRDLNLDWLRTHFAVEAKDELILGDCEQSIIQPGGQIFFAEFEGEIVGCFAFIKMDNGVFELGKMAVDPSHQGRQIGQQLMHFGIEFARACGWRKIVLYSNTKLGNALHIYRKFGFREVPIESDVPYVRSDIKMEFSLEEYE